MTTRHPTLILFAALAAVAGCQREAATSADDATPPAPPQALPFAARAAAPTPPVQAQAQALPLLALSEDGLDLVDAATGATRHLSFAMPFEEVLAILGRQRSDPPQRGVNEDCGAGALDIATWGDGLSVLGQDDRFAGWSLDGTRAGAPARADLTTMAGIGLGSSRKALEALGTIAVSQTSLGTEFAAGGLHGVLASAAPDATIVHLWAGTSCIFR